MALQSGTQGAGAAIKQIVIALINGENADPNLRNEVGGNLTIIQGALADLSSYVSTLIAHMIRWLIVLSWAVVTIIAPLRCSAWRRRSSSTL